MSGEKFKVECLANTSGILFFIYFGWIDKPPLGPDAIKSQNKTVI